MCLRLVAARGLRGPAPGEVLIRMGADRHDGNGANGHENGNGKENGASRAATPDPARVEKLVRSELRDWGVEAVTPLLERLVTAPGVLDLDQVTEQIDQASQAILAPPEEAESPTESPSESPSE